MEFYRIEEVHYEYGPRLYMRKLYSIKETPCGHWIHTDPKFDENSIYFIGDRKRWISNTSRKRYAYPTLKEALIGYRARKRRQINILTARLDYARLALAEAEGKDIEQNLQRNMY